MANCLNGNTRLLNQENVVSSVDSLINTDVIVSIELLYY